MTSLSRRAPWGRCSRLTLSHAPPAPCPRLPPQPRQTKEYCGCKLQNFPENLVHELPLETLSCSSDFFQKTKINHFVILPALPCARVGRSRPPAWQAHGKDTDFQAPLWISPPEAALGCQPEVTVSRESPLRGQGEGGKHWSHVGVPQMSRLVGWLRG